MSFSTVWLLRHGQRLDFVQPQWFLTAPYPYDPPLSAQGIYQALVVVGQLSGQGIGRVLSSPHLRALQTAQPVAQALGMRLRVEFGLREWLHAQWSDGLPATLPAADNPVHMPVDTSYNSLLYPQYPESENDLLARADFLVEKLIMADPTDVLIVAHKHILLSIVSILNGEKLPESSITPATLIALNSRERTKGSWRVQKLSPGPSAVPDLPS